MKISLLVAALVSFADSAQEDGKVCAPLRTIGAICNEARFDSGSIDDADAGSLSSRV